MIKLLRLISMLIILITQLYFCSTQEDVPDPAMLYVYDFQEAMQKMFPTQTFTFDINPGQQQKISVWPQADVQKVIVAFYVHNQENPEIVTGHDFFADCQLNGAITKTFPHQKVGACTFDLQIRPSIINLKFRSNSNPLTVYLSYEFQKMQVETIPNQMSNQDVPTLQEDNKKKLTDVSMKFERVKKNSQLQQGALRMIVKSLSKHDKRLESDLKYAHYRIVIETLLIVFSGVLGMWIIKKQLNNGYQLLV